jgi:site-specific DNA-methyltransferase (adenine-specific)
MTVDTAPFTLEITQDAPAVFHASSCCGSLDLRLGDCMDVMKTFPDGYFDLAVVDPPYGLNMARSGEVGGQTKTAKCPLGTAKKYKPSEWDAAPPPHGYFEELRRVSKHQIIWGANHFMERVMRGSPSWIVWDKINGETKFADAELAYTSHNKPVRIFKALWNGFQRCEQVDRIHPTQKPVKLYDWIFANYATPGMKVLDTHLGSGSIAIAAHYAGVHLTACEIDPDYFHAAKARIARETSQAELFSPPEL